MSDIPSDLRFSKSHEWVRIDEDNIVTVGISDHAQSLLGDLVFVELPEHETTLSAGDEAGVVESVKAASDIYSPLTGTITDVNEDLTDSPELVNQDPYGAGWIFRLEINDAAELDELLDSDEYGELAESE